MTVPARQPATYEDILVLPEHVVGEIIDGELVVSPRPAPRHTNASSVLTGALGPPFQFGDGGPGGWWIQAEPELHLGEHVLVPDLAGWRTERMPSLPEEAFFTLSPDWVCEILSPGTGRTDRTRKRPIYARAEISFLWLVDPAVETLEAFGLQDGFWVLLGTHGGDESVRVKPFEDVVIHLNRLWGTSSQVSR
jgi:Uma2 family endonuclease